MRPKPLMPTRELRGGHAVILSRPGEREATACPDSTALASVREGEGGPGQSRMRFGASPGAAAEVDDQVPAALLGVRVLLEAAAIAAGEQLLVGADVRDRLVAQLLRCGEVLARVQREVQLAGVDLQQPAEQQLRPAEVERLVGEDERIAALAGVPGREQRRRPEVGTPEVARGAIDRAQRGVAGDRLAAEEVAEADVLRARRLVRARRPRRPSERRRRAPRAAPPARRRARSPGGSAARRSGRRRGARGRRRPRR